MSELKKWIKKSAEVVHDKYGRKVVKTRFELPSGKEADYYLKDEHLAVNVVALTKESRVIMARQYRPGPDKILNELPGGAVDDGETPQAAIEREFFEETGHKGDFEMAGKVIDDAFSSQIRYVFVARNCYKVGEPDLGEDEFIEVKTMSLEEFRDLLRSGEMTDIEAGYMGLDRLGLL